jgi:hypothetical protein
MTRYSMSTYPDNTDDTMYRVMVDAGKNCIRVQCIGMYCVDNTLEEVTGIGQRISEDTFWVYQ